MAFFANEENNNDFFVNIFVSICRVPHMKQPSHIQQTWVTPWTELENSSRNIGIEYVINPALYESIVRALSRACSPMQIVDFGAGTSSLAFDLFVKQPRHVAGLTHVAKKEVFAARKQVHSYMGIDAVQQLVDIANKKFTVYTIHDRFRSVRATMPGVAALRQTSVPTLAVSRNFLMHLSNNDLIAHLSQVRNLVGKRGQYIISFLNPEYEQAKHDGQLAENGPYAYTHGQAGELGTFLQYFRTLQTYESFFVRDFCIQHSAQCRPITTEYQHSHARYYTKIPMAYVYVLQAK